MFPCMSKIREKEKEAKCGFVLLNAWMNFFLSSPPLRALVFIAHGAGEHCGPYDEIAQRLKELSLLVFAHDHSEWPDTHITLHYFTLMPAYVYI